MGMLTILDQIMVMVASLLFLAIGWSIGVRLEVRRQQIAQRTADKIHRQAEEAAAALKDESAREAEAAAAKLRADTERELEELRSLQEAAKETLQQRQIEVEKKEAQLLEREKGLSTQLGHLQAKEEGLNQLQGQLHERQRLLTEGEEGLRQALERQAGLSEAEAKAELLARVERENHLTLARRIRQAELNAKEEADAKARRIIAMAIQKWSAEQVVESTLSVVNLPSDEMKGRIIGREGRNIRLIENLTGVDLIIDDTPEAVLLSSFDPIRREIARLTLEKLVADGRIHPAKIEEMVTSAKREMEERIMAEGDRAALEAGVTGLRPELIKYLGRLRFRTSYGQNMLSHSLEVSFLAARMASELGLDTQIAARAGLLHDVGKAVTADVEGPHAIVGGRLCEKYGENEAVVHCVQAHHEDIEQRTLEAMLVQAADAISAARPGARRENVENYIKRLENLERIAASFEGIEQVYAIQAGREVRVFVNPKVVGDLEVAHLANQIAARIEEGSQYPGMVLVTVVRENRQQACAQ